MSRMVAFGQSEESLATKGKRPKHLSLVVGLNSAAGGLWLIVLPSLVIQGARSSPGIDALGWVLSGASLALLAGFLVVSYHPRGRCQLGT